MKIYFTILIMTLVLVFSVSQVLPKKGKQQYSDDELRKTALSRNMSSIPDTYEDLLKLVETPNNKLTKEKITLGRDLYFDKILSKNKKISCSTCHLLSKNHNNKKPFLNMLTSKSNDANDCVVCHLRDQSGTDRLSTAVGHDGQDNPLHINTLTTLNSALSKYQTWDGSVKTVEEEVGNSILDSFKMKMSADEVKERLMADSEYVEKFNIAFANSKDKFPSLENTQKAIASYLRILLTRSDYDRFLDGDNSAMSQKAKKGLANFINFGCKGCHTGIGVGGQSIQKFPARDYNSIIDITNSFNEDEKGREVSHVNFNFAMYHDYPFENIGGFMGKNDQKLFRVPVLRNVTKTSPYFHNGSVGKIREAIAIMAKHQLGMNLTDKQIDEIVAFLKALEGDIVDYKVFQGDEL
jgi:cytochrome c peroxidase